MKNHYDQIKDGSATKFKKANKKKFFEKKKLILKVKFIFKLEINFTYCFSQEIRSTVYIFVKY